MLDNLKDEILLRLGPVSKSPNGFMKRNCMMCDMRGQGIDKRKRFGIVFSDDAISMNCFNCAFKTSWRAGQELSNNFKSFLGKIGFSNDAIKKIEFDIFRYKFSGTPIERTRYSAMSSWDPMDLPETAMTLATWAEHGCTDPHFLEVCKYAARRRFHNYEQMLWSPDSGLNKRLILPFYFRAKVVGYTARYVYEIKNPALPKYMNYMAPSFIYNYDPQTDYRRKVLIVCEGVFDAYQVDGVSPLGSINSEQADIIDSLNKEVVVSVDRDKAGMGLYDMAVTRGWGISFPQWDKGIKDAAAAAEKYGRLYAIQTILENVERDPVYLKVKKEIEDGRL